MSREQSGTPQENLLAGQFDRLARTGDPRLLRQLCVEFGALAAGGTQAAIRAYRVLAAGCLRRVREKESPTADDARTDLGLTAVLAAAEAAELVREREESNAFRPRPSKEFIVCLDVDGVLADNSDPSVEYRDRKPYPGVAARVKALRDLGAKIYVQTARYMRKYDGDQARASSYGLFELECWLRAHGIPFDGVWMGKCGADAFVDDRAFHLDSNLPDAGERWLELLALARGVLSGPCPSTNSPASAATPTRSSSP